MGATVDSGAERAEGRIISLGFHVRFIPPAGGELGDTDMAMAVGEGLVREAVLMLKNAGEAEGFVVEVRFTQSVY